MAKALYTRRELMRSMMHLGSCFALPASYRVFAAEDLARDKALRKKAKYHFNFASPYDTSLWQSSPHMHREIKSAIEHYSRGEIYVNILDKGIAGIGPKLMARISSGQIHGALVSAANLAPIAPVLDILNIPFWSANNQAYLNLVTSQVWQRAVVDKIQQRGIMDVMFHYVVGARTISVVKPYDRKVLVPSDINDLMMRVPTSALLENFYALAGAETRRIPWGRVAQKSREKRFHLLDPSLVGLFNGPDQLRHEIASISEIESVQDSWLAVINQSWLKSLPVHLRDAMKQASEQVFSQQLAAYPAVANHCRTGLKQLGVEFRSPSKEQQAIWYETCGPEHASWDRYKNTILQDKRLFDRLIEATQINNGYSIQG